MHSERQAIVPLKEVKQWKHEIVKDYYDNFLQLCVVIPQKLDDVYLRETFREGLKTKLKLTIIGMLRIKIVEIVNLAKEIEEKMHAPHRSRQSQPLSNNEYSNEESSNDEKKKKRKNHK